jgi:hypothetical protein
MVKKPKRRALSIEDVFRKPKYKNLLDLIRNYTFQFNKRKLKFMHIRYALCEHHGLNLEGPLKEKRIKDFFNLDTYPAYDFDFFKFITEEYSMENISKECYEKKMKENEKRLALNVDYKRQRGEPLDDYINREKKREDDTLYCWIDIPNLEKFSSHNGCMNALTNLKRLNLIKKLPDEEGNDYYILTEFGSVCFLRKMCHNYIDILPDSNDVLLQAKNILQTFYHEYYCWNKLKHEADLLCKTNLSK